jgi:hypothetical protein
MREAIVQRVVGGLLCASITLLYQTACTQTARENELSKADGIRTVKNILTDAKTSGSLDLGTHLSNDREASKSRMSGCLTFWRLCCAEKMIFGTVKLICDPDWNCAYK